MMHQPEAITTTWDPDPVSEARMNIFSNKWVILSVFPLVPKLRFGNALTMEAPASCKVSVHAISGKPELP